MNVLNGWPQKNVVEYFLFISPAKYTRASLPARKMLLFSSIIITIILSYAIIRIYTIWYIYLQVSKLRDWKNCIEWLDWVPNGDEAEEKGTDEQPLFDNPPLISCGETYSAW